MLRLPDQSSFFGDTVQFLATDPSGLAGVLPPGVVGHITLYFQASTTSPVNSPISFALGVGRTASLSTGRASRLNTDHPISPATPGTPSGGNFLARVGSTAGQLNAVLAQDANYLSLLGETNEYDVYQLLGFEIEKANARTRQTLVRPGTPLQAPGMTFYVQSVPAADLRPVPSSSVGPVDQQLGHLRETTRPTTF